MAKRKLHAIDRFIYFINVLFALLLLLSYVLPYISPKYVPFISILNFAIPILILINLLFVLYWILKLRRQLFLSTIVLLLGYSHITSLFIFADKKEKLDEGYKLMSYNVRHFNIFKWIKDKDVIEDIINFIQIENPDFIAFQDYNRHKAFDIRSTYPYYFVHEHEDGKNLSTSFYSKYPIVNKQKITFENTNNGALLVDVKLKKDTIRIVNLHLESLKIKPDMVELRSEDPKLLVSRVDKAFKKQAEQIELILPHLQNSPYKNMVIGDFNNTAFSYVYRKLKNNNLIDAFKEKGSGFGKTFDFDFIPIRIDHALVDKDIRILDFYNYDVEYSDHYPIMVEFDMNKK